jgi:uncharacterized protein YggE
MRKFIAIAAVLACSTLASAANAQQPPPSITVSGNGKVLYVPDIGYIHVGVSSDAMTAAEAWKKNAEIVKKIFEALKQYGVEDKDLTTTNISVTPRYLYKDKEQPKFLGYTVSYDLSVKVRKLDQMGQFLDSMVEAGANRNMNVSFGCSKLDELMDEARAKAVAEARKKANIYVTGAGAHIGDVLGISDTPYYPGYRQYPVDAMALKEGKTSLPIAAGEQELSVQVTVTWSIDNTKYDPTNPQLGQKPPTTQPSFPIERLEMAK